MRYEVVGKVVTDQVLFTPVGDFGRWARDITDGLYIHGVGEAPVNKRPNKSWGSLPVGSLKASIRVEMQKATLRTFQIELSANTPYAGYVHQGTTAIYARGLGGQFGSARPGEGLYLPANPGYGKAKWRQRVRGQSANPYLRRAWNNVALHHSSMGRFSTLTI